MTKEELLEKYYELHSEMTKRHNRINNICRNWLELNKNHSDGEIEMMISNIEREIEKLASEANNYYKQYSEIIQKEKLENEKIIASKKAIKSKFGVSPDDMIITGGVLSSKASESHLIGRNKTLEEITQEKEKIENEIKTKVRAGEMTLTEASKLTSDLRRAYANYDEEEVSRGRQ